MRSTATRAVSSTRSFCRPLNETPHHDITSFLAYAARTKLDPKATVYVGTLYEYTAQSSLARLGLSLTRSGGRLDRGIDLWGTWRLPALPPELPLKVLVQCKALREKAKPAMIRELEGAFAGVPEEWKQSSSAVAAVADNNVAETFEKELYGEEGGSRAIMAVLVAPLEATKGVQEAMARSSWPMGFAKVTLEGRVEQLLWNRSAVNLGLGGVGVTTRFKPKRVEVERGEEGGPGESLEREVVLTWDGGIWEFPEHEEPHDDNLGGNTTGGTTTAG